MSGARRRAGLVAAISIAVLLTAWCRERIDRPRPEPPPQGWNPAEHATQRAEQQTLEMGKVLFLEGTLFRNLRIETDLMLEPGGVAEIFFHRRERDIQVQSDYGLVGRKTFDWYALRVSARPELPCGFVKSTGLNQRGQSAVVEPGRWLHLRIISRDGEHVAWIDDVEVDRFQDFQYPWGESGLVPIEGRVEVRGFTSIPLSTPDRPPLRWPHIAALWLGWMATLGIWAAALRALDDRAGAAGSAVQRAVALGAGAAAALGVAGVLLGGAGAAWAGAAPLVWALVALGHVLRRQHHLKGAQGLLLLHALLVLLGTELWVRDTELGERWDPAYAGGYVKDRFLFWHMEPGSRVWESYINSFGFRGREIDLRKPAGTTRVLCLGSSSTYGDGIADSDDTYPAVLEDLLNAGSGRSFEVINGGVSGYTTFQALMNLRGDLLRLDPDIVTIDFTHNDKVSSEVGVPYREHWERANAERGRWVESTQGALRKSRLYMGLVALLTGAGEAAAGDKVQVATLERQQAQDEDEYELVDPRPSRVPPDDYRRNLREFCAVADSVGFDVVFILEPEYDFFYETPFFSDYYEIMRAEAKACRRPVVDSIEAFRERRYDVLFYDDVHMTELGTELLAQTIYSTLRAGLPIGADLAPVGAAIRRAQEPRQARRNRRRTEIDPVPRPKPQAVREGQSYLSSFTEFYLGLGAECDTPDAARSKVLRSLRNKEIAVDSVLGEQAMFLGVAGLYRARSDHESTLSALTRAAEIDPAAAAIQIELAREAIAVVRFDLAREALRAAIDCAPGDARPHSELAALELRQGRALEAIEPARAAVERDARSARALYVLGEAYRRSGKFDECHAAWRRLIEVAPNSDEARRAHGATMGNDGG